MDLTTPNPPSGLMASFPGQKSTGPALPNPVLGLTATAVNAGQVNLAWTTVSGATGYNVFRGGVLISSQSGTSLADTTVAPATTYSYAVQAVNAVGTGLLATATVTTPPAQVTGLTATALSSSSIGTAWTATPGASTYTVKRGSSGVGTPATNAFTDTGLAASTLYSYTVAANGAGGQGAFSAAASATTQASAGASIPFTPGIRVFSNLGSMDSLATIQSYVNAVRAVDVNNKVKGLVISPRWAQLEGATLGDYSAGFTAIGNILTFLQSVGWDLTIRINGGGNGYSPNSNPAFLSSFCPAYMNAGTKGSPTDQYGGGEVHIASDGVTPLDRPYIVIWNINVVHRLSALFAAFYAHFGLNIYRWDPYQEFSISASAPGYSSANLLNIWPALCSGLRAGAPRNLIMMKPTFINPSDGSSYPTIISNMQSNSISMACEDGATLRDWAMKAYLGIWASTPVNHTTAHGGNPDWDYQVNFDPAELWKNNSSTAVLPPATYGSGQMYRNGSTGLFDFVDQMKGSHADVYTEGFGSCPNCNKRMGTSGVPVNPPAGPAPGSNTTRPNLIDAITGNTSFTGVLANGWSVNWTTYPFGYPT